MGQGGNSKMGQSGNWSWHDRPEKSEDVFIFHLLNRDSGFTEIPSRSNLRNGIEAQERCDFAPHIHMTESELTRSRVSSPTRYH